MVDYAIHKGFLVILTSDLMGRRHFFMPLGEGNIEEVVKDMIAWSYDHKQDFKMIGVTEQIIEELSFLGPDFTVSTATVSWDYIYNTEDLITLKGKKFHGKRNHINKFDSMYDYEYVPLEPEHLPLCQGLLDAWSSKDESSLSLVAEKFAVREALDNFVQIGLTGGCLFIDGKLGAFTLGQPLNALVYVIHVEKALYGYEGIYSKINQCFAAHNCAEYKYINREEDMGIEGLRKSKMSYNPIRLLKKSVGILPYEP